MINRAAGFGIGLAVVLSGFSSITAPLPSANNLTRPETPPPMPAELPGLVARRIKLDLAKRVNVPIGRLNIYYADAANWSDDCLELAYLDEVCQPRDIQGWEVLVREGETFNAWGYRSDRTGRRLRLNLRSQSGQSNFSSELSQKLLHTASEQLLHPIEQLSIGDIEAVTWNDSCFDISHSDVRCTQTIISGFRAIVTDGSKEWVYHLSADGSQIVHNTIASDLEGKVRVFLTSEREIDGLFNAMPKPNSRTIFQSQYRSWPDNYIVTIALAADGKVTTTHTDLAPETDVSSLVDQHQISIEDVAAFQTLLEQQSFSSFDQVGYYTDSLVAFEGTHVITGMGAIVELFHAETYELPQNFQPIVDAWEEISLQP